MNIWIVTIGLAVAVGALTWLQKQPWIPGTLSPRGRMVLAILTGQAVSGLAALVQVIPPESIAHVGGASSVIAMLGHFVGVEQLRGGRELGQPKTLGMYRSPPIPPAGLALCLLIVGCGASYTDIMKGINIGLGFADAACAVADKQVDAEWVEYVCKGVDAGQAAGAELVKAPPPPPTYRNVRIPVSMRADFEARYVKAKP